MSAHAETQIAPAHAVYAPSDSKRWTNCTASAEAIAAIGNPESVLGEDERDEGTNAHEEIERCLGALDGKEYIAADFTRLVKPVAPDHSAAYGISLLIDYVRQLPPGRIWIERRVELTKDIWGRCDVAHFDPVSETLTIVDYKNGFIDVQAEENEQLQIYASGSIYTHNLPAKGIRMVVVQPNSFMPVPRVKQWPTSADALFAFATRVAGIPKGEKTFTAGSHCRYCPLFGRCPPTIDLLSQLSLALQHTPEELKPDQVALFAALKKPIEDWFKTSDKIWMKKAMTGTAIPGMKLVKTATHRAWKNEESARKAVVAAVGDAALDLCTPAQAERLGMPDDEMKKLAEAPEGGPALAFESDKRKTFARKSGAEMFAAVATANAVEVGRE